MTDIWFTADQHYGDEYIMRACKRPFASVAEQDEILIERHNAAVKPDDRVFMLGDFGLGDTGQLPAILDQLNGQVTYIWGNHDGNEAFIKAMQNRAVRTGDLHKLSIDDFSIILCHYPIAEWEGWHRGSFHLHGHSHGTHPSPPPMRRLDVGVDVHDFRPVSFDQMRSYMQAPDRDDQILRVKPD